MRVAIIGGGASGLACGIFLARSGHRVSIFERKDRVGKKLLTTGNGRCNVSNVDLDIGHFHSIDGPLPKKILEEFSKLEVADFFASIGIDLVEEARGKLFPVSLQANAVLNALRAELSRLGVEEIVEKKIDEIIPNGGGFILRSNGQEFPFDRVVVAAGGMTMPKSGSDGSAYELLRRLGHQLTERFPGICALQLQSPYLRHLAGTKVVGQIDLWEGDKVIFSSYGEILLAKDGVSGPPVLDLARYVHERDSKKWVSFPMINHLDQLGPSYREILESRSYMPWTLEDFLQGVVSKKWIHVICKEVGLGEGDMVCDLDYSLRTKLLDLLFSFNFPVMGTRDFEAAQVTCGGLSLGDFDPSSLESKLVPGLYGIGEILDLDGDCGGYNLHWAWASAWAVSQALK